MATSRGPGSSSTEALALLVLAGLVTPTLANDYTHDVCPGYANNRFRNNLQCWENCPTCRDGDCCGQNTGCMDGYVKTYTGFGCGDNGAKVTCCFWPDECVPVGEDYVVTSGRSCWRYNPGSGDEPAPATLPASIWIGNAGGTSWLGNGASGNSCLLYTSPSPRDS